MLYLIKIVYNPVYRDNFYNPKERLKGYILNYFLILTLIIKVILWQIFYSAGLFTKIMI